MARLTGLFRRGSSFYLKVVLPQDHPARNQYRSGRKVVSLGACAYREAVKAGTLVRADILRGHVTSLPLATADGRSTPPLPPSAPLPMPDLPTLREVYGRWTRSKHTRSKDSVAACGRALALFEAYAGDLPLDQITRLLGDGFRAWLLDDARRTTSKTARDRFTWIKTLLKYAHQDLALLPSSPWTGLDVAARTTNRRRPWTGSELHLLFSQPLHSSLALPSAWNAGREAAYWLPILGLYTGARLSELAQLTPTDVRREGNIWFLDLNDDGPGKQIKTDASRRRVPLHSDLLRLGFVEFTRSRDGCPSLWATLPQRSGKAGGFFSQWFGTYRQSIGLAPRPDFHCFRHTVRSSLARSGAREDTIDALLGHEPGGSTGNRVYTHRALADLAAAVEALSFPLPKIEPWQTARL